MTNKLKATSAITIASIIIYKRSRKRHKLTSLSFLGAAAKVEIGLKTNSTTRGLSTKPSNRSAYYSCVDLCANKELEESELVSQLRVILKTNPDVVHERGEGEQGAVGYTLLHHAALRRSPEFCQMLLSLDEDLVRTADTDGSLPFYLACEYSNTNTAKYLY